MLLPYFRSLPGFNANAIEMLISVIQSDVTCISSDAEARHCMWASTVNWKGGVGKNIEIDLLQENRNKDMKRPLKQWALTRQTRKLIGLVELLGASVQTFNHQVHQVGKQTRPLHTATDHLIYCR